MPITNYKTILLEKLRDAEYAAGYLTACCEEGHDVFLIGMRDVVEAKGGVVSHGQIDKLGQNPSDRNP